ncbi:MAG TPA: hypothetical protein VG474_00715, partial [Solirubrobacteraceae bacterium]|nr:hypothetical protein [Solirubrobacteraceae bacterium]
RLGETWQRMPKRYVEPILAALHRPHPAAEPAPPDAAQTSANGDAAQRPATVSVAFSTIAPRTVEQTASEQPSEPIGARPAAGGSSREGSAPATPRAGA